MKKRAALICYFLAVTLACVWVPWDVHRPSGSKRPLMYGFLWSPPRDQPPAGPDWDQTAMIELAAKDLRKYDPELALLVEKRVDALKADWQRQQEQEYAAWEEGEKQTTVKVSWDRMLLEILALTGLCGVTLLWTSSRPKNAGPQPKERYAQHLIEPKPVDAEYFDVEDQAPRTREDET